MNIISSFKNKNKGQKMAFILLVLWFLWLLTLLFRSMYGLDDFDVFFQAGKRISQGEDIYGPPFYNNLKYYYSPLFALLLSPITKLPIEFVKFIWFLMNYLMLIRCIYIIVKYSDWNFKGVIWVVPLICLVSTKLVMHNFLANQLSFFILWSLIESFHLYKRKKPIASIFLFCIGLNFKIISLIVLPFYFVVNRIKYKSLFLFFTTLLLIIPALFIGWDYNRLLHGQWWAVINPTEVSHVVQTSEAGYLDIGSLISRYFTSAEIQNESLVNIANLDFMSVFILTNFIRLALLTLVVFVVRKVRKDVFGIDKDLARVVSLIALVPMIMPHQRDYAYLFILPMLIVLILLLCRLKQKSLSLVLIFLICLSGLLAWSSLLGSHLVDIFYIYRLMTIGMICLLLFYLFVLWRVVKFAGNDR